jgi:putative membrane protein
MAWLKRIVLVLAGLLVVLVTTAFFLENQTAVFLSFIGWQTPALPLSFFVLSAFSAGGLMGVFLGQLMAVRCRVRLAAARQELARCKVALDSSRTLP